MRKALIVMILAATAMTPAAAQAQRHNRGNDGGEARSEQVMERHQQRSEARSEPRQVQVQQQQQQQVQVVQRERGDGGNRGNWRGNGGGGDGNRGNWRGNDNGGDNNRGNWRGDDNNNRGNWRGNDNNNAGNNADAGQRNNWRGNRGGNDGGNWQGRNNQGSIYPQAWQGDPNDPRLQHYRELERRNQQQGYRRSGDGGRDWRNDRNRNDWRDGRRDGRRGDWNRGWRNDNRYDWQRYRYTNRNFFHLRPYYSPYRNYGYTRFSIGLFLDSLFYDQRYWIGDPWQYRLPPAPYGTQWVRYFNDVILVDVYTGEVVDVIYDFFW